MWHTITKNQHEMTCFITMERSYGTNLETEFRRIQLKFYTRLVFVTLYDQLDVAILIPVWRMLQNGDLLFS